MIVYACEFDFVEAWIGRLGDGFRYLGGSAPWMGSLDALPRRLGHVLFFFFLVVLEIT